MQMALNGTTLLIRDADETQFAVIRSWNKMKWNRSKQVLTGIADMELLDKLNSIVRLPLRSRPGGRSFTPSPMRWTTSG